MRDEEYCEVMNEAYRDVLQHIITTSGTDTGLLIKYLKEQIAFHIKWREEV